MRCETIIRNDIRNEVNMKINVKWMRNKVPVKFEQVNDNLSSETAYLIKKNNCEWDYGMRMNDTERTTRWSHIARLFSEKSVP
jgi:hypothetical protein